MKPRRVSYIKARAISFIIAAILVPALLVLSNFCAYVIGHSHHFDFATATCSATQGFIAVILILAMTKLLESLASHGWQGLAVEGLTEITLILREYPADKKVRVIKVIREITGLGIRQAKNLVEYSPSPVKVRMSKFDFEFLKSKLEEIGVKVEIK